MNLRKFFFLLLLCMPMMVYAANGGGFGDVADNISTPVSFLTNIVHVTCFIIGGAFLFTALVKYFEHKRSPLMVPVSTIVFLVISGLILIALPLFLMYAGDLSGYASMQ